MPPGALRAAFRQVRERDTNRGAPGLKPLSRHDPLPLLGGGPSGSPERINDLVASLRAAGFQAGDTIPREHWDRIELLAFGSADPSYLRGYRRALQALGIVEQVGGGRGGVRVREFRIRTLPTEDPLLA